MKRIITLGLSLALLAGGASSCKKTNKRKLSNEWKVSESSYEYTYTDSDGDKQITKTEIKGDNGTQTVTQYSSGTSTSTVRNGTVKENTFTIDKKGTFEKIEDITWVTNSSGNSSSTSKRIKETGTWSFLSKNKSGEFKKNERVVFNTLSQEITTTTTNTIGNNSTSTTTNQKNTYAEGANPTAYVVEESKSKELKLKNEFNGTASETDGGQTSNTSDKTVETITLVKK